MNFIQKKKPIENDTDKKKEEKYFKGYSGA